MENEDVVSLLREIRDLQKLHVENYKDALQNQQTGIAVQAKAAQLQKRSMIVLGLFATALIVFALWSYWPHH